MKRKLVVTAAAVLVLAAGGAAALLLPAQAPEAKAADPRTLAPLVNQATAKLPGNSSRSYTGTVGARVQSDLGFRVPGKIVERYVEVGEQVKAGQPLMGLDPTQLRLTLTARKNAVVAAQATFNQAQADEKRYSTLIENGMAASRQRYEQARAALDTAKAQLDAAQAEAAVAENEVTYAVLVADADGVIVDTLAEPGQVVTAGQAVVRLARSGPREAIVWMPETLLPEIGAKASASIYGRSDTANAVLRQMSNSADQQTRTYETRWVLEGAAANAPLGATVTIRIDNVDAQTHAELPVGALIDDGSRTGVWVVDQQSSSVKFRDVKIERLSVEYMVVTNVRPGEVVVGLGAHLLKDGDQIRTSPDAKEAVN